ncbi:MAG: pyroglutamyl-peptidase I [Lachnospiraceae bacterium]|nr:pyroglutamyl-peptidase I [Lachnospiraceae bacterium]
MKKLLITCFEPFGGDDTNASLEAVTRLPDTINDWKLTRLTVPVVFGECAVPVLTAIDSLRPDAVLLTGQAAGRKVVTPERYAHNLRFGRIPDNAGNAPMDVPVADGPDALVSTINVRRLAAAIRESGVPAEVSLSAGAYVCNDLYYQVLLAANGKSRPLPVCFIHVPSLSDGYSFEELSIALQAAVLALDDVT